MIMSFFVFLREWRIFVANIKSAIKRARQNPKRRLHNASARSMLRTYIKKVIKAVESGEVEMARAAYTKAQPIIDKAVNKGLIHKNKAARTKSRLAARIKAMAA
jgi:small subunit ribosomal protein S20